jgi:chromosome segregation ATPase
MYEEGKDFLYVEDNPGLIRDKASKAIINIDHEAYERYKEAKAHKASKDKQIENLENEIKDLKELIYKMVEGGALGPK